MAARRLLIVMLILLGLSTLAAALVPQRTLRNGTTTRTTNAQGTQTAPAQPQAAGRSLSATLTLDATKEPPVVAGPVCTGGRKPRCAAPFHVGDQLTLQVYSRTPSELQIPEYGLLAFATANAPARFELLADAPGRIGILFAPSGKVAAGIEILPANAKRKQASKSRARGGSGRP